MTTTKRTTTPSTATVYDKLFSAQTAAPITIYLRDGRAVQGSLVFNPLKGTGRVIDVEKELSTDFSIDEIRDLRFG